MTYTTQQLEAMSDHTVNNALYHKLFQSGVNVPDAAPDYCNNPNDIMPLAFERKMRLEYSHFTERWSASAWKKTGAREQTMIASFCDKDNPLRAIACLLLLMED